MHSGHLNKSRTSRIFDFLVYDGIKLNLCHTSHVKYVHIYTSLYFTNFIYQKNAIFVGLSILPQFSKILQIPFD